MSENFGMHIVSSEQKEEERLARILSGPIKPKTPVFAKPQPAQPTATPTSPKPTGAYQQAKNAPVESKAKIQARAVKTAIDNAERDIAQGQAKVEQHLNNIVELRKKIEQEEAEIERLKNVEANLQVVIMEKCVELEALNEEVAKEDAEKEQKAAQIAKEKEEFEARVQEQKRQAAEERANAVSANASSSYKTNFQPEPTVNVASFASRFQQEPVKDPVVSPRKPTEPKFTVKVDVKNPQEMTELEKEQERLTRAMNKDPAKQPVKLNVAPVPKAEVKLVEKKEPAVRTPSLLEQLQAVQGTEKTFRYETWDALDTVSLIGSFTNWQLVEMPRIKGVFLLTLPIPSGSHLYRYRVNNKWELEKNAPRGMAPDGEFASKFEI